MLELVTPTFSIEPVFLGKNTECAQIAHKTAKRFALRVFVVRIEKMINHISGLLLYGDGVCLLCWGRRLSLGTVDKLATVQ